MLEKIQQPIDVEVVFLKDKVLPRQFLWDGRIYKIRSLTMVHQEHVGRDKLFHFSVTDGANFFRLTFSTRELKWQLSEVYTE